MCFNPHPKTLTMAGDYEYFAAQGHHPLAFALAELVDNALRATKGNKCAFLSFELSKPQANAALYATNRRRPEPADVCRCRTSVASSS